MDAGMQKYLDDAGIMERGDADKLIAKSWDTLMENIPSKNESNFQRVKNSFSCRQEYTSQFGFVLLSKEVVEEMTYKFNELGVTEFIELGAGTGFLTKVLIDNGLAGMGYTLPIPVGDDIDKKVHWGFKQEGMYNHCVEKEMLELGDMRDLINIAIPKMIISAWVPYGGGTEVVEFFDNNGYPEYYTVIGESYGGCTGNDEYHDWLDTHYERTDSIDSYESFSGIYDNIDIYKKKEK